MKIDEFTKYERARILGARALQIAMNAPLLIKIKQEDLEEIKFDALKIAEVELNSEILPISIKQPVPEKTEETLRRTPESKVTEKKKEEMEVEEEQEIAKAGEIMELANPEEEREEEAPPADAATEEVE
jgi:DNA-directed RNA polymerase subunit K/omega